MALIGTISGSNGTSNTAVSGTLVVANATGASFPAIPADASLLISGAIGGRGLAGGGVAVVGGDMVVSGNAYFSNANVSNTLNYLSGVAGEQRVTGNLIMSGTGVISSIDTILLTDGAGTIYVDPSSSIYFADAWTSQSNTWPEPYGVRLSATGSEWDDYYTLFGTSSLLSAISASAGGATPAGGTNTQVQFNDSGSFGGEPGLSYEKATATLNVSGTTVGGTSIELGAGRSTAGTAYIDFHSTAGSDAETRLLRNSGIDGDFSILSYGSGNISIATDVPATGIITLGNRTSFPYGLSGSLTKLTDGTSYLVAGTNIGISSSSNGSVTIANTMTASTPGGSNTQVQFNDSGIFSGSSLFTFNKSTGAVTASYFSGSGGSFTNLEASQLVVAEVATIKTYLELQPVNVSIPTNVTASYIYTSGSTNDMYFTQYNAPYTNTTRLRWLEGVLTTGLLHGGILTTATGSTTFSVTAGSGMIVAANASTASDPYPTINYVQWPSFISASLDYSGSAQVSYISINASGTISQLNTAPTLAQFKDRIILGRILHQTGSVTNAAINSPAMSFSAAANIFDFVRPFGPLKVSGHILAASGSTMGLTKTAGDSYSEGRNYAVDPASPNTILASEDTAMTTSKLFYQYVSGSTSIINTGVGNAGFTFVTASLYNNNGTLAAVSNSEWTNQRVFWFPRSSSRAMYIYFGSKKYTTLLEAISGINTEDFVEGDNTKNSAIFVGTVSLRGNTTNLSDTVNNKITQAGLFRGSFGGGGGGGVTPPAGSTTQIQFNDAGAFGADSAFTWDNTTKSLTVTGNITGSNLRLTGDLLMLGGDLSVGANTIRIWDGTAPTVGTDSFFYVSGSTVPGVRNIVHGGYTVLSGGFEVKDTSGTLAGYMSASGAISGSSDLQIGGNITGSNARLVGDLAVNGGNLTTNAAVFNLVNTSASSISFGGAATSISVGASGGSTYFAGNITGSNVLSSGSITIGNSVTPALFATAKVTSAVGNNTIYNIPTASCDGAFFDYVAISGSNARAGHIVSIRSGSSVNFNETTTTDFGTTTDVTFGFDVSGGNMILTGSTATAGWTIKTIVRAI